MALQRENALTTCIGGIAWLATACELLGKVHLFNTHTISHEFFRKLLNEIFGLQLVVMDRIHPNFPAIDLGDEANKRSFQVTAENSLDKIQATIDTYMGHGLAAKYGQLQVIIIGDKKKGGYKKLNVPAGMAFDPDVDIIDNTELIKLIEGLNTDRLDQVAKVVQSEIRFSDFPSGLYLHVSVHNSPRMVWPGGEDTRLSYVAEQVGDSILIQPFMPYLEKMKAGGPIEPLRYQTPTYCPFDWGFPALDFKLVNRTSIPFLFAEAIFEVEESVLDPAPVIAIKEDLLQSLAGTFRIVNEGPIDLEDVTVRYQMLPGKLPTPAVFPDAYPFGGPVGSLHESLEIVVDEAFAECGVDIERLNTLLNVVGGDGQTVKVQSEDGTESVMTHDEHTLAIKTAFGSFEDGVGTVIGEIEFVEPSSGQKNAVRFRAVVYILNANRKLAPKPPSFVYQVELDTIGSKYQKVIPISQELLPGATDRFLINVAIRQPSVHRLRVTFKDVGGHTIQSQWIHLRCFIPRTRRGNTTAGTGPLLPTKDELEV